MRIIAIVNQKGGVGKTTTTANLAHALARKGHKVAVLDFDPQAHLTAYLGYAERQQSGLGDILLDGIIDKNYLIQARDNLTLLPAGTKLKQVEVTLHDPAVEMNLQKAVDKLLTDQDMILIDCPPASGTLIRYALSIVDEVLVPVAGDYLALRGLSDLIGTLRQFASDRSRSFTQWLVVTRFHTRRRLCSEVRDKLVEYFPKQVFVTAIRETSVLAESPSFGKTAFEYKRGSHGHKDYQSLAKDLLKKRVI